LRTGRANTRMTWIMPSHVATALGALGACRSGFLIDLESNTNIGLNQIWEYDRIGEIVFDKK
jgi:hypothetical protein